LSKDVWQNGTGDLESLPARRIAEAKDSKNSRETLVQLADETVAAPALAGARRCRLLLLDERSCTAVSGSYPAMAVSSLDRRSIQDENDE